MPFKSENRQHLSQPESKDAAGCLMLDPSGHKCFVPYSVSEKARKKMIEEKGWKMIKESPRGDDPALGKKRLTPRSGGQDESGAAFLDGKPKKPSK